MGMLEWAKHEVELACTSSEKESDDDGFDYVGSCYESALKAFKSLCEDGHSGMSIGITQSILNAMIDGRPLSPIEDTDDVWEELRYSNDGNMVEYQCKRMSSLFKEVYNDGTVKYSDVNRAVGIDQNGSSFHGGRIRKLIDERYPITMPYLPYSKPYKVYTEDFLVDPSHGDYDTEGILYLITPEGEHVDLDMYWTEKEPHQMVEISKEEYLELRRKAAERVISQK